MEGRVGEEESETEKDGNFATPATVNVYHEQERTRGGMEWILQNTYVSTYLLWRQPDKQSIRFKAIPEMEDAYGDKVYIEPTARHGFQLRNEIGDELLNTRFEIDRHILAELRTATEFNPEPSPNWSRTSWEDRVQTRHRLLHSRFRDKKLKRKNKRRKRSGSLKLCQTLMIPVPDESQEEEEMSAQE